MTSTGPTPDDETRAQDTPEPVTERIERPVTDDVTDATEQIPVGDEHSEHDEPDANDEHDGTDVADDTRRIDAVDATRRMDTVEAAPVGTPVGATTSGPAPTPAPGTWAATPEPTPAPATAPLHPAAASPVPLPPPAAHVPVPEDRGPRAGTVVWGLVVAAVGIGILAVAAGAEIDGQLALIVLLAGAGAALLVGSVVSSVRRRGREGRATTPAEGGPSGR